MTEPLTLPKRSAAAEAAEMLGFPVPGLRRLERADTREERAIGSVSSR